jgi:hypothetical protein
MTRETDPTRVWLFQALLLDAMTVYTGKSGPAAALRIKLTEVLYVPWIWQWCSMLCSQANASGAVDLSHSDGTLLPGGELVHSIMGKNVSEHQIVHLELPTMHEPLVILSERLMIPCILESCLPSSLVDEVDMITSTLVLRGFIVCLDMGRGGETMVTSRGITTSTSYTKKKGVSPVAQFEDVWLAHSMHGSSSIHLAPCFFMQT